MARITYCAGVVLFALFHVSMSATIQDFFPDFKSNLTNLKWAHAVNSDALLKAELAKTDHHMIEGDVIIGTLNGTNPTPDVLIMAHPPATISDLSMVEFVNQIAQNKTKGMKLDFKTTAAVEKGIVEIEKIKSAIGSVPVWLNADIVVGPSDKVTPTDKDPDPVNATTFFQSARKFNNEVLLSIGWTTRLEPDLKDATTDAYTQTNVDEMLNILKTANTTQTVTYAVRACYAVNNSTLLKNLVNNEETKANNPTLTIWSGKDDKVNATKLSELILAVGIDKVYVDVPEELWKQLNLGAQSTNSAFSAQSSLSTILTSIMVGLMAIKLL